MARLALRNKAATKQKFRCREYHRVRRVWPCPWISSPVSDVRNLFSDPEPPWRNPGRAQIKLVAGMSAYGRSS